MIGRHQAKTELMRAAEELKARVRQQATVAELGQRALVGTDLCSLMDDAVALVAQTLEVEYCKVLELLSDDKSLLLRAGVGWKGGYVGHATVGAGIDSQAGYTLFSEEPVIVEDLRTETRFSGPPLLHDHAVVGGMSVIIHGPDRPFGVLGAHSSTRRTFTKDDIYFLQAVANVLAAAIERKRAEEALREREEQHRLLVAFSPYCIHQIDREGRLMSMNEAGLKMIGVQDEDAIRGMPYLEVVAEEDRERIGNLLEVAYVGDYAEFEFKSADGRTFASSFVPIIVNGIVMRLMGITQDITERKWAEEALRESKRRLEEQNRVLVELTRTGTIGRGDLETVLKEVTEAAAQTLQVERVGVWLYNEDRSIIRCIEQYELSARRHTKGAELAAADYPSYFQALEKNRAIDAHDAHTDPRTREFSKNYLTPHGITSMLDAPIRVAGEMVGIVCHEHVGAPRQWILEEQSFAGSIADIAGLALETHERKRAEEALRRAHDMLELAVQERTAELSKAIGILEEQIGERHRAEEELRSSQEQLRALSVRLLSVQEEERSRIAREIHDELGQALTALKIDLAWVDKRLPESQKELLEKIQTMNHLVDTTVRSVRRISAELRPRVLDHLGLVAALEWQMREFQDRTGIACEFATNLEEISVDTERATTVFRISQEALTNVSRHADATRVKLNLKKVGRDLVLEVRDNGRGIRKEAIADPKSLGLIGMRERVLPWGGDVDVKGFRGKGTVVSVRIPVGEEGAGVSRGIA